MGRPFVMLGQTVDIMMEFDVPAWFNGADIASGEPAEGVVYISNTSNKSLYDVIKNNIDDSKLVVYDVNKK